jgi:hypothetical protein
MLCGTRILTDPRWRRLYRTITRGGWARKGSTVNSKMLIDQYGGCQFKRGVETRKYTLHLHVYAVKIVSEPTKRLPIQHGGCQKTRDVGQ